MMSSDQSLPRKPDISDDAVQSATGKTWDEWFSVLNTVDATKWTHQEIVAHLKDNYDLSGWWQQSVAVNFEKAYGLRDDHEQPDGYAISASKTVNVGVDELFRAWEEDALRRRWLNESFAVRKATPARSLRITWNDDTNVDVYFYEKGEAKSQVAIQHSKLVDKAAAEERKAFWREALRQLKVVAED